RPRPGPAGPSAPRLRRPRPAAPGRRARSALRGRRRGPSTHRRATRTAGARGRRARGRGRRLRRHRGAEPMTATFARFGNDLHDGRRTVPIVTRRRVWYLFSLVLVVLLVAVSVVRGPNLGIEFTGGSELQIAGVSDTEQSSAREVVRDHLPENEPLITLGGQGPVRVHTEQLASRETAAVAEDLAAAYGVSTEAVSPSYSGAVWSGDAAPQMLRGV